MDNANLECDSLPVLEFTLRDQAVEGDGGETRTSTVKLSFLREICPGRTAALPAGRLAFSF